MAGMFLQQLRNPFSFTDSMWIPELSKSDSEIQLEYLVLSFYCLSSEEYISVQFTISSEGIHGPRSFS